MALTNSAAEAAFRRAEDEAAEAVNLYATPVGGGGRHSVEHQGIHALAEAIRELAHGMQELSKRTD